MGRPFGATWGYVANGLTAAGAPGTLLAVAWSPSRGHTLLALNATSGAVRGNWTLPFADCVGTIGCGQTLAYDARGARAVVSGFLSGGGRALGVVAIDGAGAGFVAIANLTAITPALPGAALGAVAPPGAAGGAARGILYVDAGADGAGAVIISVDLATGAARAAPTRARLVSLAWDGAAGAAVGIGAAAAGEGFALVAVDAATGDAAERGPLAGVPAAITFDASIGSALDAAAGVLWWESAGVGAGAGVALVATRVADAATVGSAPMGCFDAGDACPWILAFVELL